MKCLQEQSGKEWREWDKESEEAKQECHLRQEGGDQKKKKECDLRCNLNLITGEL